MAGSPRELNSSRASPHTWMRLEVDYRLIGPLRRAISAWRFGPLGLLAGTSLSLDRRAFFISPTPKKRKGHRDPEAEREENPEPEASATGLLMPFQTPDSGPGAYASGSVPIFSVLLCLRGISHFRHLLPSLDATLR